jgi:hypothetical protein
MSEQNTERDDLIPLDDLVRGIRARLQTGGPDVDYSALFAFLDEDLAERERAEVELRIARWAAWHDAYWQIRADLDDSEASQEVDEFSRIVADRANAAPGSESRRQPEQDTQASTIPPVALASPGNVLQELLRRAQQEPQAPLLSEEQRDCVRVLRGSQGLAMRELVDRVGVWRTDCKRVPLSAARLSGSLQDADWLFQQVEVEVPARGGVRGGPLRVGGYRLRLDPELVLARTCGPLLARLSSDPQARQALIDYATDLGLPESYIQDLRGAK